MVMVIWSSLSIPTSSSSSSWLSTSCLSSTWWLPSSRLSSSRLSISRLSRSISLRTSPWRHRSNYSGWSGCSSWCSPYVSPWTLWSSPRSRLWLLVSRSRKVQTRQVQARKIRKTMEARHVWEAQREILQEME
ncbi:unnamed protein product, partial [Arabidopsis halleri]